MAALRALVNASQTIWRMQCKSVLSVTTIQPQFNQIRTFKDLDVLELRCMHCKFKKINDRWHVLCDSNPRHKQRERFNDIRKRWIVTHITRGGRPFQKKPEAYILNLAPPGGYDYKKRFFFPDWDKIRKEWFPTGKEKGRRPQFFY